MHLSWCEPACLHTLSVIGEARCSPRSLETELVVDTSLTTDCENGIDFIKDIAIYTGACSGEGGTQTVRGVWRLANLPAALVLLKQAHLAQADVHAHFESNFIAQLAPSTDWGWRRRLCW